MIRSEGAPGPEGGLRRPGLPATAARNFRVSDVADIASAMALLRARGIATLAGSPVTATRDLADGGPLPPTDALIYLTAAGDRLIVRPSGTEPKLKCYLEAVLPCSGRVPHAAAADRLAEIGDEVTALLGLGGAG